MATSFMRGFTKRPAPTPQSQRPSAAVAMAQPQQPSGLRALSPQEFRSVPQQPAMSQDAFAKQQADVLKFFQAQQKVPQPQMTAQQKAYIEKSMAPVPMETAQPIMPPSAAMQKYTQAQQAGTAGDMAKPAFKKGGVVKKKPGYAKGGVAAKKTPMAKYAKGGMATPKASNCGASMKPQQRKK